MSGMGKPGNLQTWVYSLGPDTWFGSIVSGSSSGGTSTGGGDSQATYVILSSTGSLPNARVLQGRGNVRTLDGGAGTNVVLVVTGAWTDYGNALNTSASVSIDPLGRRASVIGTNVAFFVSGGIGSAAGGRSVFGGDVLASGSIIAPVWGLSGSHTTLADGVTPAFLGAGAVAISTSSLGQVVISGSGAGIVITGSGGTSVSNAGLTYTVSSSVGAFSHASYVVVAQDGKNTQERALVAGTNITINDSGPGGNITINATGGGGSGATTSGGWVDAVNKVYTTGSVAIDGANGNNTADFYGNDVFFYVSGTRGPVSTKKSVYGGDVFTSGSVTSPTAFGFTGSLTRTTEGNAYIVGTGTVTTSTNSSGQVVINGSTTSTGSSNILNTYNNRGAAGVPGRIFFGTDTVIGMWLDDGSTWRPLLNGIPGYETPLSGTFTPMNQTGSILTQYSGSLEYQGVNDGNGTVLRGFATPLGSSSVTAFCEAAFAPDLEGPSSALSAFSDFTLFMRESSTQKAFTFGIAARQGTNNPNIVTHDFARWTSNTARDPSFNGVQYAYPSDGNAPVFVRLRRDNTTLYAESSRDRRVWKVITTALISAVFTSFPNQMGFGGFGLNTTPRTHVLHWLSGSL